MASAASNKIKQMLLDKYIDFGADTFIIILMASGFTFDIDAHEKYADVSGSELPTAGGYTQGTKTLAGVSVSKDDANDRGDVTWNDVAWTATATLVASAAIIYDDTTTTVGSSLADAIVGYIDFGGDQTVLNGGTFTIANITFRLT